MFQKALTLAGAVVVLALGCSADDDEFAVVGGTGTGASSPGTTGIGTPEGTADGGSIDGCDPAQDQCPPGTKCTFVPAQSGFDEGSTTCVAVRGDDEVGEACEILNDGGEDSCVAGAYCLAAGDSARCASFCGSDQACEEGQMCAAPFGLGLALCLDECHPLAPDCPMGWSCVNDPGFQRWSCQPAQPFTAGEHGEPCDLLELGACGTGHVCLGPLQVDADTCDDPTSSGCCAQLCDLEDMDLACPGASEACISYFPELPPPGFENLGVCAVP